MDAEVTPQAALDVDVAPAPPTPGCTSASLPIPISIDAVPFPLLGIPYAPESKTSLCWVDTLCLEVRGKVSPDLDG